MVRKTRSNSKAFIEGVKVIRALPADLIENKSTKKSKTARSLNDKKPKSVNASNADTKASNKRKYSLSSTEINTKAKIIKKQVERIKILELATELSPALLISRPSVTIKTPYIADVIPLTESASPSSSLIKDFQALVDSILLVDNTASPKKSSSTRIKDATKEASTIFAAKHTSLCKLAHAPSLDCAGMVMPGSKVFTSVSSSSTTKSDCVIQFCEELREDGTFTRVGYHPFLAEKISKQLLEDHLIKEIKHEYDTILSQQTYGKSRVDFVLSHSSKPGMITLLEVKNVVGADYPLGLVPSGRSKVGVYETSTHGKSYRRSAIFPHGSHKVGLGVVSDRAIKHIHELTQLHNSIDTTSGCTIQSVILFIVNRSDCFSFRPCQQADMLFSQLLQRAVNKGVLVIAKEIIWEERTAYLGKSLPLDFDEGVDETQIDEKHLQAVLDFNETNQKSPDKSGRNKKNK